MQSFKLLSGHPGAVWKIFLMPFTQSSRVFPVTRDPSSHIQAGVSSASLDHGQTGSVYVLEAIDNGKEHGLASIRTQ